MCLDEPSDRTLYLKHHWPMNGNGNDIVGGAHAIEQVNIGSTSDRFNSPNKAMIFASGYFTLPAKSYFTESDFTVTAWVKVSRYSFYARIIDFANGPDSDNVVLTFFETTGKPEAIMLNGSIRKYASSTTVLSLNTWWHVSFVFERNTMYIYRNGIIIATTTSVPQAQNLTRSKSYIGKSNWAGDEDFIGVMDDLRIYHKALTANEIMQVMSEQN